MRERERGERKISQARHALVCLFPCHLFQAFSMFIHVSKIEHGLRCSLFVAGHPILCGSCFVADLCTQTIVVIVSQLNPRLVVTWETWKVNMQGWDTGKDQIREVRASFKLSVNQTLSSCSVPQKKSPLQLLLRVVNECQVTCRQQKEKLN